MESIKEVKLETVYKYSIDEIVKATPVRQTAKMVIFPKRSDVINYATRCSKEEYLKLPKTPEDAANKELTRLHDKIIRLQEEKNRVLKALENYEND